MTTNEDTTTPETIEEVSGDAAEVSEDVQHEDTDALQEEASEEGSGVEGSAGSSDPESEEDDADTFPRDYVERLRQENGRYRQRAQRADALAHRLHRELIRSDGRLQDPTDLDFSDEHLADDGEALTAAIDELLSRKPHLAARKVAGNVGQGATRTSSDVNLLGLLRGN